MIGSVETPLSRVSTIYYRDGFTIADYHEEQRFSKSTPILCVLNGEPVLRKHWNRPIAANDTIGFVIIPRGSGLKSIIGVLAQVVVTVGVTLATGNLALGVAVGAAVGAVFNLLITPKMGGMGEAASPTYSIEAQGNSARLLQPIPRGYGLHNIFPDFASQPYTTFEGNDQILFQLFCCGLGEYDVSEVRIGQTSLWHASTGYSDTFEDVTIQIVPPGQPVTLFPAAVQNSPEVSNADMLSGNMLGPYVVNAAGTKINRVNFDRVFPGGLFDANDKGKLKNRTVQLQDQVRLIDDTGAPLGAWQTVGSPSYTRSTSTAQRFTDSYDLPLGRYEAQTVRVTPDADSGDTSISDKVQWVGLRGFEPSTNTYPNVTLLAVKIKATNQLSQQSSRLFNVIQTAKIPVWNGEAWSDPQPTRSIAWAAADMLRNSLYGEGRPDSLIDLDKLLQLDAIWTARGDTFNGVFDTKRTFWEAINLVLATGRAQAMLVAGVATFVRDEPRMIPNAVFTPHNIRAGSFETEHVLYDDATADDIIVEYQDERTWKTNEVQCSLDGSLSENPARINIFGITNYAQAWREGMYQAASNMYRRITAGLLSEMEGKLLLRGQNVLVAHDMPKWGTAGEVRDYDPNGLVLTLSEPADWSNPPWLLSITDRRGKQYGPISVVKGETDFEAVLDNASLGGVQAELGAIEDVIVTDPNMIPTRYVHGSTVRFAKRFIVTGSQPQSFDAVQLDLVNDDPRVYAADTGAPPAEAGSSGPGIDPNAPTVTNPKLVLDPASTAGSASYAGSWDQSPGATLYIAQISYDGVSFETVYEGTNTSITFVAQANEIVFRVAAIGLIRGPWAYFTDDYTDAASLPLAINDLRVYVGANNSQITGYWGPTLRATSYYVEVKVGDDVVINSETASLNFLFTNETIQAAGGPWPAITVDVYAKNSVGMSAPAHFAFNNNVVVTSPAFLTVSTDNPAMVSVQAPADNTWSYVRLFKGATDVFNSAAQIGGDYAGAVGQVFTYQDAGPAGTNRYFAQAFNSTGQASAVVGPIVAGASSGGGTPGGGGGSDGDPGYEGPQRCVTDDTPIILANEARDGPGATVAARDVREGDWVWTRPEAAPDGPAGAFRVLAALFAVEPVMAATGYPRATAGHRFFVDGRWTRMDRIGAPAGFDRVIKMTVEDAHTYLSIAPDGTEVLSHNIKQLQ